MAKLRDRFLPPAKNPDPVVDPALPQFAIEIRQVEVKTISLEEHNKDLGPQATMDALMVETFRRSDPPIPLPSLVVRQKLCRERMDAELKKLMEQSQERAREMNEIRTITNLICKEQTVETTCVWIPQVRSSEQWFSLPSRSDGLVLPIFSSAAFVEDFIEAKQLDCDPSRLSLRELFVSFSDLRNRGFAAAEFNHCPRCTDPRPVHAMDGFMNELDLLKLYAATVASRRALTGRNHRLAMQEADPAKRLAILRYSLAHIDPGAPAMHLEIAKIAVNSGDSELFEQSRRMLAKHAPDHIELIPHSSGLG